MLQLHTIVVVRLNGEWIAQNLQLRATGSPFSSDSVLRLILARPTLDYGTKEKLFPGNVGTKGGLTEVDFFDLVVPSST
jgi:hypothetical protein